MLERVDPHELLDPDKFADSLSVVQAGGLLMFLKPTKHTALGPLKLALERRVRESPIKHGIGKSVMAHFGRRR